MKLIICFISFTVLILITGCVTMSLVGKEEITDDQNHPGHVAIQIE